ncbi:hypothetical protein RCL1_001785 [Eukaryota sp. TZLM3-RCL]
MTFELKVIQLGPKDPLLSAVFNIRRIVFVEEQNVPLDLEYDEYDEICPHFLCLALIGDSWVPVGTVRLVGNKVGRLAVLKEFRHHQVGSCLMKHIVNVAKEYALESLTLGAQCHCIAFYERLGFVVSGDVFLDAGIDHRTMNLEL